MTVAQIHEATRLLATIDGSQIATLLELGSEGCSLTRRRWIIDRAGRSREVT